jgi:hypothetical protein
LIHFENHVYCSNYLLFSLVYFFSWWLLQHILLGVVPFLSNIPQLKELRVCGVVTLNESYERFLMRCFTWPMIRIRKVQEIGKVVFFSP